jgi:hypothetical protein
MAESGIFSNYYYYRITRKIMVAFANLFKDIQIIRYTEDGLIELERIVVPISYGTKEKWFQRITQDPNLQRAIQVSLPRIGLEMNGIDYDDSRKQISTTTLKAVNPFTNSTMYQKYIGIPHTWDFTLSIYTRNMEDGLQIIEQILPIFKREYIVPIVVDPVFNYRTDVPIIIKSSTPKIEDEGNGDEERNINWELQFTARSYLFGPTSNQGLILQANTAFWDTTVNAPTDRTFALNLYANVGIGATFTQGEYVFQGNSLETANAKAIIVSFSPAYNRLYVRNPTNDMGSYGIFQANTVIIGASSGTTRNVSSYYVSFVPTAVMTTTPNPPTANSAADSFGFITKIKETPNTP